MWKRVLNVEIFLIWKTSGNLLFHHTKIAEYPEITSFCFYFIFFTKFLSRMGTSPYDGSININSIMKGNDSWDSVTKKYLRKDRKLSDLESSTELIKGSCSDNKFVAIIFII